MEAGRAGCDGLNYTPVPSKFANSANRFLHEASGCVRECVVEDYRAAVMSVWQIFVVIQWSALFSLTQLHLFRSALRLLVSL